MKTNLIAAEQAARKTFGGDAPIVQLIEDAIFQIECGARGYVEGLSMESLRKARRMAPHRDNGKLGGALYRAYGLTHLLIREALSS